MNKFATTTATAAGTAFGLPSPRIVVGPWKPVGAVHTLVRQPQKPAFRLANKNTAFRQQPPPRCMVRPAGTCQMFEQHAPAMILREHHHHLCANQAEEDVPAAGIVNSSSAWPLKSSLKKRHTNNKKEVRINLVPHCHTFHHAEPPCYVKRR
eukprot:TRINITY_DN19599_c0_g1_i1.p1 TRINITY_DN19599_c0_g1~~TRINITY_DN19599_c0_g1_i1.p1  ORF type:complete len:159 (+),score=13.95 TRINITY_DN19599_c0_g1_i1:24-479(+)